MFANNNGGTSSENTGSRVRETINHSVKRGLMIALYWQLIVDSTCLFFLFSYSLFLFLFILILVLCYFTLIAIVIVTRD